VTPAPELTCSESLSPREQAFRQSARDQKPRRAVLDQARSSPVSNGLLIQALEYPAVDSALISMFAVNKRLVRLQLSRPGPQS
jgi:hypothetical protein